MMRTMGLTVTDIHSAQGRETKLKLCEKMPEDTADVLLYRLQKDP
jgi:hypothetical protein